MGEPVTSLRMVEPLRVADRIRTKYNGIMLALICAKRNYEVGTLVALLYLRNYECLHKKDKVCCTQFTLYCGSTLAVLDMMRGTKEA